MSKSINYEVIVATIMETKSDELNDWESGFINDIFSGNYERLTDLQKEKIRDIHTKYCKCK